MKTSHLAYPITFDTWMCSRCLKQLKFEEIMEECPHGFDYELVEGSKERSVPSDE